LDSKPVLTDAQGILWSAFWLLNSTRQAGFEIYQHLQMVDIVACASMLPENTKDAVEVIVELDRVWYDWYLDQRKQQG